MMDIGVNLASMRFETDLEEVLGRAQLAGVGQFVAIGVDLDSSVRSGLLVRRHPGKIYATAGVHPHRASALRLSDMPLFRELWADAAVVAVGETGLDYHRMLSPATTQRAVFEWQLEEALVASKPVFLHCRDAHEEFLSSISAFCKMGGRGLVHCFTGGARELEDYLALGLDIGVSGWVCDLERGRALREALPLVPSGRLHLETDAPFLPPAGRAGLTRRSRNEPAYLVHVAQEVASLRGECPAVLAARCAMNSRLFFDIPEPSLMTPADPEIFR